MNTWFGFAVIDVGGDFVCAVSRQIRLASTDKCVSECAWVPKLYWSNGQIDSHLPVVPESVPGFILVFERSRPPLSPCRGNHRLAGKAERSSAVQCSKEKRECTQER